ncbi:stage III sporulation protein AE [Clostridium carnis]
MERIKKITKDLVIVISIFIIASVIFPTVNVYANDKSTSINIEERNMEFKINEDGYTNDDKVNKKLENLYDYINNMKTDVELMNELNPLEYFKSYMKSGEGNISFKDISKAVVNFMFKEVKTVLTLAITIIIIAIICSLLKNLQSAFSSESISNIAFFACYALLIVILSKSFLVSITLAKDIIIDIGNFMAAILPILVIMLGSAGGFTQAATMDPIVIGATILVPRIYLTVIIPLILATFVLEFANNISTEHKISNLCKLMKQITLLMQGIVLTVFIGLLTIRGISASTIDAVTLKTAKFAIDNFIPIVGKAFSDAIASFAGYSLIIKNAISSIGLITIILLMLYPIIKLALMSLVYKLTAALIEPISDKRITGSIAAAGDSLILIMSCVISVSLMFFILLSVMASAGKFVIGG